jgi:hypothetical protein
MSAMPSPSWPPGPWKALAGAVLLAVLAGNSVSSARAQDSKPYFAASGAFVIASGRWKPASGDSTPDLTSRHTVEIQCRLDIRQCFQAMAEIVDGEPQVSLQSYRVVQWDKNGIIAEDDSPVCTTNRLLVNFQEQSVTSIDMPKKDAKGTPAGGAKDACQLANRTWTYNLAK